MCLPCSRLDHIGTALKRLLPIALIFPILVSACSDTSTSDLAPEGDQTTAPTTTTDGSASSSPQPSRSAVHEEETPTLVDPGDEVGMSEVGKELGFDCVEYGDCSVFLTVEKLEVLDDCPGLAFDTPPDETQLVRVQVLIETKPSDFDYDPSTFAIGSEWSVLTQDGINQPLPQSSWCTNPHNESNWSNLIRVGDTVRHVHLADVPLGSSEIRLTERTSGGRFVFPAP